MKTLVFVSSDSGIASIPQVGEIGVLPDRITFSEIEYYYSPMEMDYESFLLRMKLDATANPKVEGCDKDEVFEIFEDAIAEDYEQFFFILSQKKMNHYKPMIEEYREIHPEISILYYEVLSEAFPVSLMAMEANAMFMAGKTPETIVNHVRSIDENNLAYIYSPSLDILPVIEKISLDEDVLKIQGKNNYGYILKQNNSISYKLKEKNGRLEKFFESFEASIEGKNGIPYILYSDINSKFNNVFLKMLEKMCPKVKKIRMYEITSEFALKYGKHAVGMGYILKSNDEQPM